LEAQPPSAGTFWFGDKEITLVKVKASKGNQDKVSHYVIFPFTDTGLHIAFHADSNPILQEEKTGRNLATIDLVSARKLNVKDVRSMFRYPRHRSDVVVIPVESLSIFEKMAERPLDIPLSIRGPLQQTSHVQSASEHAQGVSFGEQGNVCNDRSRTRCDANLW